MTDLRQAAQQALEQPEQTKLTDDADTLTIVYQRGRAIEGAHGIKENTFGGNSCSSATPSTPHPPQQQAEPVGEEWTACMKLPIVVHVRQQRPGEEHVSTREGITPVKPDDLIMRGVSGEEYPIGRAIFEQTYSLDTTPPQQPAEPVQENKTLIEWKERGEAIMAQAGVGFRLGAWWADRPWRPEPDRPQPEQEPVAYYHPRNGFYWAKPTSIFAPTVVDVPPIPLYTTPPQRPWVGLNEEDFSAINQSCLTKLQAAKSAESILMKKNT